MITQNAFRRGLDRFKNATHIRIANKVNKHIIDEWNVQKVTIRKSYKRNGVVVKIYLDEQDYFKTSLGKVLSKKHVGFIIPKDTIPMIEICDKNSNVIETFILDIYYDFNGTLEIKRIIKIEMWS